MLQEMHVAGADSSCFNMSEYIFIIDQSYSEYGIATIILLNPYHQWLMISQILDGIQVGDLGIYFDKAINQLQPSPVLPSSNILMNDIRNFGR